MEDINAKVLNQGYGLKLINTSRSRSGIICKTDSGVKELRKTNTDEKIICFESAAKEHLKNNGFLNVDCFIKTLDGKPFYIFDGNTYVLTDFVSSQGADLNEKEFILKAAEALAKIHTASKGFVSDVENSNVGKLPTLYNKRKNELVKIKKWINNQSTLSSVDLIVLKNFNYYKENAEKASDYIQNSGYSEIADFARINKTFCHNSYKNDNVRITDTNDIFVTGFSKCAYDCGVVDLAEFIRRYIKSETSDIKTICEIIESYNKIKPVTKNEIDVIYSMLCFPNKFLKLCNQYYNKRRVYVSDAIIQKMEKCVLQRERNDDFLKKLEKEIK